MSSRQPKTQTSYTRREALLAVGKYSAALGGASVVALSAEEAAAQAACSGPNPPWWCNSETGPGGGNGGGNGTNLVGAGQGNGNAFGRGNGQGNGVAAGMGNAKEQYEYEFEKNR